MSNYQEEKMKAATELEAKILEFIKAQKPELYESETAHLAVKLLHYRFSLTFC